MEERLEDMSTGALIEKAKSFTTEDIAIAELVAYADGHCSDSESMFLREIIDRYLAQRDAAKA